jgi:hypothetical protein
MLSEFGVSQNSVAEARVSVLILEMMPVGLTVLIHRGSQRSECII